MAKALRVLDLSNYTVQAMVERGQVFQPGLFPGLEIDLAALLGERVGTEDSQEACL